MKKLDLVKKFIIEHYEFKKSKNKYYSYRSHAKFLDISITTYSNFVSGKRELSLLLLKRVSRKLADIYPELSEIEEMGHEERTSAVPVEVKREDYKVKIIFSITYTSDRGKELALSEVDRIKKAIDSAVI